MPVIMMGEKMGITTEGGFAVRLTNRTGVASVKGAAVKADPANSNAFIQAVSGTVDVIGAVYEAGIANAAECWVVVGGLAEGLVSTDNGSSGAVRGNWVGMSTTQNGTFDMTQASPPAAPTHFNECGHCLETKAAGTLAKFVMHFN
jgi:hypothetical protein